MAELTVVVPTLNERANVPVLLERLRDALPGISWEAVLVDDDSRDGTAALVRELSRRDSHVRIVHRIGRRGLSSAVIEGILASASPYIAVMDGDLQHDERLLPLMLERLKTAGLDIVIGSRHVPGGGVGEFSPARVALSDMGKRLSRAICHHDLQDPMSGFFMLTRSFFDEVDHRLSGIGFKILLDLLASSRRPVRFEELPYTFRKRLQGESKLDTAVAVEYLLLLTDKSMGHVIPVRYAMFVGVGLLGLLVHLAVLGLLHFQTTMPFLEAQAIATVVSMTGNFFLNNLVTYRDRRLRGRAVLLGFLSFFIACGIGAVVNFGLARLLLMSGSPWYFAGLAGMAVSSVWNFGMTAVFTWRRTQAGQSGFRQASLSADREARELDDAVSHTKTR
ncbi:MAG TPA: glycosyltransferase family 2 protein [Bryobacteraceae bacterium]|nr:glycosyltransferase family 2 protein [Bryobacteraceae bacterium]